MSILQHENENQTENQNKRRSSFSKKMTTAKNSKAKTTSTDSRKVQFSSKVFVRKFRDTVKPSEAKNVWYNDKDYESFRNDTKKCIRLVQSNSPLLDDVTYCRRGADCRTGERFKARSSTRSKACDAVLDEQERQWTDCSADSSINSEFVYDDEAIAQLYYRCTLSSQRHAQLVGLSDERAAAAQEHLSPKSETGRDYSLPRVDSKVRLQFVSAQA